MTRGAFARALGTLVPVVFALPLGAQTTPGASPIRQRTAYEDLQMFSQVLNQIRVNHPDSVDTHALLMSAIAGMVHAADPHSYVIPAIRLEPGKEQQLRDGKLVPVPIDFTFYGGTPIVASVAAGTSASRLDVLPGDELVSIDGKNVLAESAAELDIALAGPKGTDVALAFERRRSDGSRVTVERRVKRERAADASAVPVAMMLDQTTGYIRITTFVGARVAEDLHAALGALEKSGMQRLVLDLRDNGGGSVAEAAQVAGEFLPKGAIVYTSEGRKTETADTGRVSRSFWQSERRYPIVVMLNDGTASASELVAGALQDHDRALLVGRPSFGKSLLMRGFPLSDGSTIVLVIGRVRTPCGRIVQREYHAITRRDYYRLAGAERDTAGRPTCKTDGGRVVYGGGGIYPDILVPEPVDPPLWVAKLGEQAVVFSWMGGYVDANAASLTSLDTFAGAHTLPASALADFRTFAQRQGVTVPTDAASDAVLQRLLVPAVAFAKWGDAGRYRVLALLDGDVSNAVRSFDRAAEVLRTMKP